MSFLDDEFPLMPEVETDLRRDSQYYGRKMPNTRAVLVGFGLAPLKNDKKSRESGYDVFDDVEFVKIVVPGDRQSLFFQPVTDVYRRRFPDNYRAFKDREQGSGQSGQPLEKWAPITRGVALTLKARHIHTVEALAAIGDEHIDSFGSNVRVLREKAQTWLKEASDGAAANKAVEDNADLRKQLAALQAQLAAMNDLVPADVKQKLKAAAAAPVGAHKDTTADIGHDVAAAARRPRPAKAA